MATSRDAPEDLDSSDSSEFSELTEVAHSPVKSYHSPFLLTLEDNAKTSHQEGNRIHALPLLSTRPITRVKSQHNPDGNVLGLIRKERDYTCKRAANLPVCSIMYQFVPE